MTALLQYDIILFKENMWFLIIVGEQIMSTEKHFSVSIEQQSFGIYAKTLLFLYDSVPFQKWRENNE